MRLLQARYVTACQQLLALGVVLVVLTPAASVVTLEVVVEAPTSHLRAAAALVPTAPVDPKVAETELTAASAAGLRSAEPPAARATGEAELSRSATGERLVSEPQPVTGFGTVGLTWSGARRVDEDQLAIEVRTGDDGRWSGWTEVDYHDEHGPDPGSREAARVRPGTDALVIGEVDEVQVRIRTEGINMPADLTLAVVDPGVAAKTNPETPALTPEATTTGTGTPAEARNDDQNPGLELQAGGHTPKPQIFSRAQWGANESWRSAGSLRYYEVHAGFVHHTVTTNSYSRAQVPGIIRSIYAYHTRSRGWSDIGYNFLVDRFGRVWEGRYGGVGRPVVGAHTLGYNDHAFAMSAIGNYETTRPSAAMLAAFGSLMAWKLSLHGVGATATGQRVGSRTLPAISGHRDAGQTACPGRYLYAQLGRIRQLAAAAQGDWSGRELDSNLTGSRHPDVIGRRASDGRMFVIPTGGPLRFRGASTGINSASVSQVAASPDLTGDGDSDLLVQYASGLVHIRPGEGQGRFGSRVWRAQLPGHDMVSATGDLNGDGTNDWVARHRASGELVVQLGRTGGTFHRATAGSGWGGYNLITGVGDVTGDGRADLAVRSGGNLAIRPGDGSGGFRAARPVPGRYGVYDQIVGMGDVNRDGHNDLVVRRGDNKLGFTLPGRGDGTFKRKVGPFGGLASYTDLSAGQVMGGADIDLIGVADGKVVVRQHRGTFPLREAINTGRGTRWADLLLRPGDWNRDGHGDVIGRRRSDGAMFLLRGNGRGGFAKPRRLAGGFGGVRLLSAVGDVTGDGWPDLMGQPTGGSMRIYPGRGAQGLRTSYVAHSAVSARQQIGVGRWDGDGAPDSVFRQGDRLRYYSGNGPGGLTGSQLVGANVSAYDRLVGVSDLMLGGHSDLVARESGTGRLWMLPGSRAKLGQRRFLGDGGEAYDLIG